MFTGLPAASSSGLSASDDHGHTASTMSRRDALAAQGQESARGAAPPVYRWRRRRAGVIRDVTDDVDPDRGAGGAARRCWPHGFWVLFGDGKFTGLTFYEHPPPPAPGDWALEAREELEGSTDGRPMRTRTPKRKKECQMRIKRKSSGFLREQFVRS
ncbi:hypothetical protein HPB47_022487 [Ixodes persulcatus]|uniref:Uncharacterized protein n=1 Tax=Ixodes persulcatus TaxID=34615 RepID=A0AC60QBW0_IXOPE|nr:hypothetical protein HPB47_022487 [Ixodes persulcatus]